MASPNSWAPAPRMLVWLMAATIFSSAFLLFQVQPLISKFILPWFGGSPTVWTTAMLFFQCLLFAGYAYAHFSTHSISPRLHLRLHLGLLLLAACTAWMVIPSDAFKPNGDENPALRILLLLGVSVGLPYFALASTGPMVQAWFSRVRPGESPYRLYSLSNVGSFLALLSFPYALEPNFQLKQIAHGWTGLFWFFAAVCGLTAYGMLRYAPHGHAMDAADAESGSEDVTLAERPAWLTRLAWIGLPAIGSLTMIAATDHMSHHISPEPRLWIMTLGLYLLTFIITFDHPRWYSRRWVGVGTLIAILFLSTSSNVFDVLSIRIGNDVAFDRWSHLVVMFLICFLCHGELVRLRPRSHQYLTEFYLCISAGGAIGGLFASLVAVQCFDDFYEWPLCLCFAMALAAWCVFSNSATVTPEIESHTKASVRNPLWRTISAACLGLGMVGFYMYWTDPFYWGSLDDAERKITSIRRERNFYGVLSVDDIEDRANPERSYRGFYSGSVTHGLQMKSPEQRLRPATYYGPETGFGEAMAYMQQERPAMRIAVVGLGAGSIAAYGRNSDRIDFYEINPAVIRIAEEDFTFLRDCRAKIELILGDARLKMEGQRGVLYDMIVLDAYTGGSVPIHLLTEEAFDMYREHLAPRGMIVAHITNSYLNLYPQIKLQAEHLGMLYRCKHMPRSEANQSQRSFYFVMTEDAAFVAKHPSVYPPKVDAKTGEVRAEEPTAPGVVRWTDHFSSINAIEIRD